MVFSRRDHGVRRGRADSIDRWARARTVLSEENLPKKQNESLRTREAPGSTGAPSTFQSTRSHFHRAHALNGSATTLFPDAIKSERSRHACRKNARFRGDKSVGNGRHSVGI